MQKVRVYELARDLNISSKDLVDALKKVGINVSSHMSTLEPEVYAEIIKLMGNKSKASESPQPETTKPTPEPVAPVVNQPESSKVEEIWEEELSKEKVRTSLKKKKKRRRKNTAKPKVEKPDFVEIPELLTVGELAKALAVPPTTVIASLMQLGIMANVNQVVDIDAATLVGEELGITVKVKNIEIEEEIIFNDDDKNAVERPPIVTVMGHVDHGKTSLLDRIRKTSIIESEAGGITQHIGAYQTEIHNKKITFLDTPGHAAFTEMRARGAQVTDIVILVVAADDGIMPQTVEAINHAKAAQVPIIVAINKCDKPDAQPDQVKQQLTKYELVPEEWGGNTICVNISAKTGENLEELLEAILLVAELEELKANPNTVAAGTVIESRVERGLGRIATVIIQKGTLHVGDPIVVGVHYGRVKSLTNHNGVRVKEVLPSSPVVVAGLDGLPAPGDLLLAYTNEKEAKEVALEKQEKARQLELIGKNRAKMTLEEMFAQMKEDDERVDLDIIVKADVQGSVEAITGSIEKLNTSDNKVGFKVIHAGVGPINETDVMLATASQALIIGFNVNAESNVRSMAEAEGIELRFYRVIYNLLEELETIGKGLLAPELKEVAQGSATVRSTFKVPRIGTVAGCYVTEGKITRQSLVRLYRQGKMIYEGKIASLKRFKDDVREVVQGYECGINLENFNDVKDDDVIEAYIIKEVEAS